MNNIFTAVILKLTTLLGALALVSTTAIVVLSVLGRHTNIPLPGSVEIVEMLVVIVASMSILYATISHTHASAKLFIDRLGPKPKKILINVGLLLGSIFTAALTIGNIWIVIDYWALDEASHLLGIPIKLFRLLVVISLSLVTLTLVSRLFIRSKISGEKLND